MGSLSPLATNTGLSIAVTRSSREWFGCPQAQTASCRASRVCQSVGSSRPTVRAPNIRPRTCCTAERLASEPVKDAQVLLTRSFRLAQGADDVRGPAVHCAGALGSRRGEHHLAHGGGANERDLLSHEAADREPEEIDFSDPH